MRIVTACHYYPPHVGGIEVVAQAQAESSAAAGHQVVVVTSAVGPSPIAAPGGVSVIRTRAWNGLEDRVGIPFPLVGVRYGRSVWAAIGRADVVHIHDVFYVSSHLAGLFALLRRKPLFVTQHVGLVDHPNRAVVAIQRMLYATIGALLFRRARAVVTYNANVRATVARYAPTARILEVRNGIDTETFTPVSPDEKDRLRRRYGLPTGRPIALFVGRLVAKKGYEELYRARSDGYLTVFVGGGKPPPGLADDADAVFVGPVDRAELVDYYRLSDLYVLPAIGEIFTLTMQEAMACGLPVVTSNDPGYDGYPFDRNAIRLTPRSPEALRQAIVSFLDDRHAWSAASAYCRQFAVEHFSWDANIGRVLTLYGTRL